ncbi:unnamed protein product [Cuscuta campestris]|uniref:Uncharacterized protein n=1 Tax=Cuscuta campestris TaxID=132261 RepID=A0A484MHZ9_9ASTE|nr:unnamed protein product [Cuscuta campestris]
MASSSSSDEAEQIFFSLMAEAALILLAEEENTQTSEPRRRHAPLNQDRQAAHEQLVFDYFAEHPVYNDEQFKHQFHEGRAICEYDPNDIDDDVEPVDATQQESNRWALHNLDTHLHLRANLIEHIWNFDHEIQEDE